MTDYIADANDIELPKTATDPDGRIRDVLAALRYFAANYCLMPGAEMEDNQRMVREAMTTAVEAAAASLGVDIRGEQ